MNHRRPHSEFAHLVLPHLDAAYGLARWLLRNDTDAEDVTQEACLRALRFLPRFDGDNVKAWFLAIVRNACYDWLRAHRAEATGVCFDEQLHSAEVHALPTAHIGADPELESLRRCTRAQIDACMAQLSLEFREAIVLREIEGCSYREIGEIAQVPIGTVMSRLARARDALRECIASSELKPRNSKRDRADADRPTAPDSQQDDKDAV